jgi:hypothetical protein
MRPQNTRIQTWKPVQREDILSYLEALIYSDLERSMRHRDYRNARSVGSIHTPIQSSVSRSQWQEIHGIFHIHNAQDYPGRMQHKIEAHEKVEPTAQILRQNFSKSSQPDTNVVVNECRQGFQGCAQVLIFQRVLHQLVSQVVSSSRWLSAGLPIAMRYGCWRC